MTDEQIIFLISQPRSGSTLLQAILGGHPDIHTCSEPWIALPFIYALKEEGSEFDFNSKTSKVAIKAFFNESAIDEEFYNSDIEFIFDIPVSISPVKFREKFFSGQNTSLL